MEKSAAQRAEVTFEFAEEQGGTNFRHAPNNIAERDCRNFRVRSEIVIVIGQEIAIRKNTLLTVFIYRLQERRQGAIPWGLGV